MFNFFKKIVFFGLLFSFLPCVFAMEIVPSVDWRPLTGSQLYNYLILTATGKKSPTDFRTDDDEQLCKELVENKKQAKADKKLMAKL